MRAHRNPAKRSNRFSKQDRCAKGHGFELVALERRLLMSADHHHDSEYFPEEIVVNGASILPAYNAPVENATTAGSTSSGTVAAASVPLSGIPVLNSRPGAAAKVYLDFDGDTTATWGSYKPGTTPAYDQDGDPTTFSDGEIANIRDIWARVAEKYSPFNINVTTVNPGTLTDKVATRVVIGGNGSWLGGSAGGIGYIGGFYNSSSNTVYVFPKNLASGSPKPVAEAAAHEAGHNFGLRHQSSYSGTTKTAEYNPGDSAKAPIMGSSYRATRGLWWKGASTSSTTIQDDLTVLSNTSNGFGYRADDYGNTISAAAPLATSGTSVSAAGVIEKTSDVDVFSLNTGAGSISLKANPAGTGGMLDLKLELRKADGTLVTAVDTASLGETLSAVVAAGTYYLNVASHGGYGDIGQYSLSGSVVSSSAINAPSNLTARAASTTQVNLTWADNVSNETSVVVQRSVDGGNTWSTLASLGANATAYQDTTGTPGTTYSYRVYAVTAGGNSPYSNVSTATTITTAPTNLAATATSASQINLTWADVTGETGYRIERSADGSTGWASIGTVAANVTSFQNTGLSANTMYYYRVVATNSGGASAPSATASARTQAGTTTQTPAAPTNLVATATSATTARLTWKDNSTNESGFSLQYSTNNSTWYTLGSVGANVTGVSLSGMRAGGTYYFRVYATNAYGKSPASNVASVTTPMAASTARGSAAAAPLTAESTERQPKTGRTWASLMDRLADRQRWSLRRLSALARLGR